MVSRWVSNTKQPPLETLYDISLLLKIDIRDLIESNAQILNKPELDCIYFPPRFFFETLDLIKTPQKNKGTPKLGASYHDLVGR